MEDQEQKKDQNFLNASKQFSKNALPIKNKEISVEQVKSAASKIAGQEQKQMDKAESKKKSKGGKTKEPEVTFDLK